jgi:Xaa-Pro aminopeptidase
LRGLNPTVILIATDERVFKYRHPIATDKKLERYAMIVICAERYGLVASSTRFVHFGPLPKELEEKAGKVAYVDAGMIAGTKAGISYREYFDTVRKLYAEVGYPDEWKWHHQGGPAGYATREFTVTPSTEGVMREGMSFAWNPSIAGTKSEDTILLTAGGVEIISQTGDWPCVEIEYDGKVWRRPAILQR